MTTASEATTRTLEVPGATLTYDVRAGGSDDAPLFLIGSPMAAAGFGSLAGHFADRTIVTYDPRGSERSTKLDMTSQSTPEEHADDLHRIIQEVGGPVDLFASSGGAVNALALIAAHPEDVRTLVAHEPPLASILPDADHAKAAARAVGETISAAVSAPAWRTSSPSSATRGSSLPTMPSSQLQTRRCSACLPRTTALGPIR